LISVHRAVSIVIISIVVTWCSSTAVTTVGVGVSVATVTVGISGTSVRVTVSVGVPSVPITTGSIPGVTASVSVSVARVTAILSAGGLGDGLWLVRCRAAGGGGVGLVIDVVETRASVGTTVRSGGVYAQITTASELTAVDGSGTLGISCV